MQNLDESYQEKPLSLLLIPLLRKLLFSLHPGEKVRRGLAVLKSFISGIKIKVGEVEIGLDIEPERGAADSGDIETDLPILLVAVAEAAKEYQTVMVLLIDEIQYYGSKEISALIMAMHKMQQRQLPNGTNGTKLSNSI